MTAITPVNVRRSTSVALCTPCPDGTAVIKWRPDMFIIVRVPASLSGDLFVQLPGGNSLTIPASRSFPQMTADGWELAPAALETRILPCPEKAWVDSSGNVTLYTEDAGNPEDPIQIGAFYQS